MANIVILGAGVMGSAFTMPLSDNGHLVRLVGTHLDGDIIDAVRQDHFHPKLRMRLPERVAPFAHHQFAEALCNADLVVLGVSSAGVNWAAERLEASLGSSLPIVMLTKGLRGDGRTIEILPSVLQARLPVKLHGQICAIGGPSIAAELAVRRHTSVVLAGPGQGLVDRLAGWLRTPYYHIWTSTDLVGLEVCAALKNLYTLGVGLTAGMLERTPTVESEAKMHNPAAALFAQALWEMAYLVGVMGGRPCTVWTLAGAGDLYVTCQGGRNSRMARWLGLGLRYSEAKALYMSEETVEGAETALAIGATVDAMIQEGTLDGASLPLLRAIIDMIRRNEAPYSPWDRFFASSGVAARPGY